MFEKTSPLKKEAEAVNQEATSFAKANHIEKEQQKLAERLAKETMKKALGENGGHDEDSVKLMEAQLKNAYLQNLANPNSPAAKALNNPALQDSITSSMAANVQRRQMNNGVLDFSERDLLSLQQNKAYYNGQAGGDAAFQAGKSNVDVIVAHFPEEDLQEIGLSQNALRRGLTERSWLAGKRDMVENIGARLRGERELETFEDGIDSFSEADRQIKLADQAQNEALLDVQEATLNYAQSFDPQTGRFDETLGKKLGEARSKLETEKAAYQKAQEAYIEHRRDFYKPRIEAALQEKFGDQYTRAQIKAAAVALYESVIKDQDPVLQSWPTNEQDAAKRIDIMVKNASDGLAAQNEYKTPDGTSLTNGHNPEADQVADLVYAARGAKPRNEVGSVVFDIMGRSEGTTNQKIMEAVVDQKLQVEARLPLYSDSIRAAVGPVLQEQGFTPEEIEVFCEASTKLLMDFMADLKTDPGMAADLAGAMAKNLQTSNTKLSALDPDCSKLHNAIGKAFNVAIVPEKDGKYFIKPALEGNLYGRFSLREANAHLNAAAQKNGVSLTPANMLHEQMSTGPVLQAGSDMIRSFTSSTAQKNQASDTFRVQSHKPLDASGSQVAFAKNQPGARVARLKAADAPKAEVRDAAKKDSALMDSVAPLYGTSKAVQEANHGDIEKAVAEKKAVLQGDPNSLISRSVASSAVDKALNMNSLADEKLGLDENGRPIGVSVGVSGAPIYKAAAGQDDSMEFLDIDYSEEWVQKGLSDLQVQDYITGQIDRHAGNIFIDPNSKQVKGIDNDLAFPVVDREEMIQSLRQDSMDDKVIEGLPQQIHVDTADKIEALSSAELRQQLESLPKIDGVAPLEPAAIDGAVKRHERLQQHVKELRQEGKLISQFNKETYEQAKASQIAAAGDSLSDKRCQKASYLGTAIVEKAVAERLNQSRFAHDHYKMVKKEDLKPHINQPYANFQKGIQDVRANLLNDPAKAPTPELAGRIDQAKVEIASLENKLAAQNQDLQALYSRLKNAEKLGHPQIVAPLRAAYQQASLERQETMQALKAAQQKLGAALDEAVEPLKPQIAHSAAANHLGSQIEREKDVQARLGPAAERLEAAKSNLAAARAADEAAWFEGKGPRTDEELAALAENLGAAEQELKDATEAHEQAVAELEQLKKDIPPLEKQVTVNEAALQAMHPEGIPLSENIIWNPAAPSNKAQPPKVQLGPQDSQQVNMPATPAKGSVAESMAKSRIQRPTLVRPPGPAPLPPGVAPSEDQQQGWKKVSTGEKLHQGGEAKPRVQRSNSVGEGVNKNAPDKKPDGPVIGGGRKQSF